MHEAYARQQAKNEPITSFITNIRLIFNQMDPQLTLARQIDIACNNLNPNYIPYIRGSQINSFEKLIEEGKEVKLNVEKIKNYKGPPNPSTAIVKNAAWPKKQQNQNTNTKIKKQLDEVEHTAATEPQKSRKPEKSPQKPKKDNNTQENPQKSNLEDMPNIGECYKCRQKGHIFKDCPNPAVYKYFCYSCGKGKVTVVKCPNCKDKRKEND